MRSEQGWWASSILSKKKLNSRSTFIDDSPSYELVAFRGEGKITSA